MRALQPLRRAKRLIFSSRRQSVKTRFGIYRGIRLAAVPADCVQTIFGLSERETHRYVRHALGHAAWFIDIGAGTGEMTILFDRAGKADPIFAVEPWSMDLLTETIALNGGSRAVLSERYLGEDDDQLRLDDLAVPRDRPGFIKLDADFAELAILRSGRRLIAEAKPMLLVETHSATLERDCIALLSELGYAPKIVPNAWWRSIIPEQRPIAHNRWLWAQ